MLIPRTPWTLRFFAFIWSRPYWIFHLVVFPFLLLSVATLIALLRGATIGQIARGVLVGYLVVFAFGVFEVVRKVRSGVDVRMPASELSRRRGDRPDR